MSRGKEWDIGGLCFIQAMELAGGFGLGGTTE